MCRCVNVQMCTCADVQMCMSPLQVGMLAWRVTMNTPEYPEGRDIIVIANDITINVGTFGVQEDIVFEKARDL